VVSVSVATAWYEFDFAFLVLLAALNTVDRAVLEAAALDGAGEWRAAFSVIVPVIRPSVLFLLVTQAISGSADVHPGGLAEARQLVRRAAATAEQLGMAPLRGRATELADALATGSGGEPLTPGSGRSPHWWPRATATARSRGSYTSPSAPRRTTSATSWPPSARQTASRSPPGSRGATGAPRPRRPAWWVTDPPT
jgi:hypothetical protein